ncbi:MAG: sugar ABC transporter permease [Spirochaetaceae bacterium]|jgi:raffinose/stachyose/melibiose transport system permease protein|nr:sugar ABC transporter permease [Spirochaetaceae bacterium]
MSDLSSKKEQRLSYLILILPAVLFYYAVMAFPTIFSVVLSISNYNGGKIFGNPEVGLAGFKSYAAIFQDEYFYLALRNNLYIVLVSVFGQIPLGFILAYILSRGLIKGTDFFQTMIYLPCVISPVVIGILFQTFFLSSDSVILEIIRIFNPSVEYTMNENPMIPVLIVMLWMYTGTYVIIFLANLQKIDTSIIEATKIDGANELQTLRYVILPALSGVIVTSAILAISGSLKSFDLIFVMTQGGPARRTNVLSIYMYDKAFRGAPNYPVANAISTVMVIMSFVLIGLTKSVEKRFGGKED